MRTYFYNSSPYLFFLLLTSFSLIGQMPYEISFSSHAAGFSSPIDIAHAGDDRLFVVERSGRIKIITANGNVLPTPFLDIDGRVHNAGNQSEQGLLGLAFHPNFSSNGYFYVHYIANDDDSIISRFSVNSNNPNQSNANTEFQIMEIEQPYVNHNGGSLKFGPDGYLYIGLGDGGSANDPENRAQNRQTLLGKMLRIDVDNGNPYSVPNSNPFINNGNTLNEIWAIGLRNPWKFSFDRRTGDLWIGDVGQGNWEEIDFQSALSTGGENYGWKCYEGNNPFNTNGCNGTYIPPITEYNHEGFTHCSVTGGYVYRGPIGGLADLGVYFYADYCSGRLWGTWFDENFQINTEVFGSYPTYNISSFGEDNMGNLYVAGLSTGRIYKMDVSCKTGQQCPIGIMVVEKTDASCYGYFDGSATIEILDEISPITIEWSDGQEGTTISGLGAFTYTVTVTDGSNNSGTATVIIDQPDEIEINVEEQFNVNCSGPGGAMISVQGDYPPFSILWSTGSVSMQEFNIQEAGTYTVQVTDNNDCTSSLDIIIEDDSQAPQFDIQGPLLLDCNNECTSLNIELNNPSDNLSYEWIDILQNPVDANEICIPGEYEIIVTNLDSGCTASETVEVIEDKVLPSIVGIEGDTILDCATSNTSLMVNTFGIDDSFDWRDQNQNLVSSTNTLEVSTAGNYTLIATGANGCTLERDFSIISDTTTPVVDAGPDATLTCEVNSLTLGSSLTEVGLTYQWTTQDGSFVGSTDESFVEVNAPGTYLLTGVDPMNNCVAMDEVLVLVNEVLPIAEITPQDAALGCGINEIILDGTVDDGSSGNLYTYEWRDEQFALLGTSAELIVTSAGLYNLSITNVSNGCMSSAVAEVIENQAPQINIITPEVLSCNVAQVLLSSSSTSNSQNLNFEWTGPNGFYMQGMSVVVNAPGEYILNLTDVETACTNTQSVFVEEDLNVLNFDILKSGDLTCIETNVGLSIPSDFSNASISWTGPSGFSSNVFAVDVSEAGEYCVEVTDPNNGCLSSACVFVNENIDVPNLSIVNPEVLPCSANPISISGMSNDADGSFYALWSTSNGNIVSGADNIVVQVNAPGTYCLTITNFMSGCSSETCVEVINAQEPSLEIASTNLDCFGNNDASIQTNVLGGTHPFEFNWSNGASTENLSNLVAGIYTLSLSDANACIVVQTVEVMQPEELTLSLSSTNESGANFNDGTISTVVNGGTEPYAYAWSNGSTNPNLTALMPGTYSLTLTDANACMTSSLVTISEFGCLLDFELSASPLSCYQSEDGSITVNIIEGTAPFQYQWSNDQNTESINSLSAGTYSLGIVDANNCEKTVAVEVLQPEELIATVSISNSIDCNNSSATLICTVQGGTGVYQYAWYEGATTSSIMVQTPGNGTVYVTDENGCETQVEFIIEEDIMPPLGPLGNGNVLFCEVPQESIGIDFGSSSNWTYAWTGPNGFEANTPLISLADEDCGEYELIVTDQGNGCTNSLKYKYICQGELPVLDLPDFAFINCEQDRATLEPIGEFSMGDQYTYLWTNVTKGELIVMEDSSSLTVDECGLYALNILDIETGCFQADTIEVICDFELPLADAGEDKELNCQSQEALIGTEGDVLDFSYQWKNQAGEVIGTTPLLTVFECGNYTLEVRNNQNGCMATDEVLVTCNDDLPIADAGTAGPFVIDCIGTTIPDTTRLDGSASSQGEEFMYLWTVTDPTVMIPGKILEGENTLNPLVEVPGNYTLTVTNVLTGCSASDNIIIEINTDIELPIIELTLIGQDLDCNTDTIIAIVDSNIDFAEFYWSGPNGFQSSNNEVEITEAGVYTIELLDPSNGCQTTESFEIELYQLQAEILVELEEPCLIGPFLLTANPVGDGPFEYLWSTGELTQSIELEEGEEVSVSITDARGCTLVLGPIVTPISNGAIAISDFQIIPSILGQATGSIEIQSVVGGTPPYTYEWSNGAIGTFITKLAPGEYTLTITDALGCIFEQSFEVMGMVGVSSLAEGAIELFPNPSLGLFYLKTPDLLKELKIYDEAGKLILEKLALSANEVHTFDLSSGLYLIKVKRQDEKEFSGKVLIQK